MTLDSGFTLMPAPDGKCPECAVAHEPHEPHDKMSLCYQYKFYGQHGRWPKWLDAIAHCSEEDRIEWRDYLIDLGKWDGDDVPPPDVMPTGDGTIGRVTKFRVNRDGKGVSL